MPENKTTWRPSTNIEILKKRSKVLSEIRKYFNATGALEVETPILSAFGGTDVQLEQWQTSEGYSLHTSPEFAMKRLLCAGSGDIFQICKVFRKDEVGRRHNPEFTMIEWYRVGFDEFQLITDVTQLIRSLVPSLAVEMVRMTYEDAFLDQGLPDPHRSPLIELQKSVFERLSSDATNWTRDDCLDALMALVVEPNLPPDQLTFIHQYPKSQAALAKHLLVEDICVARRFELYWQGMELANGYCELVDALEQKQRFEQDVEVRKSLGLAEPALDERFLAALESGMPECAGVALGVDRLLMILLNKQHIREVVTFTSDQA